MGKRIYGNTAVTVNPATSPTQPAFSLVKGPVDLPLLLVMIAFIMFGLVMVFSASWDYSLIWYSDPMYQFHRQILWMVLGIITAVVISFLDYHSWRKFALPAMVFTISALVLVLLLNEIQFGAVRTMLKGSLQPSELAKVVTVLYLSVWLHSKREQLHDIQWGLIPLGVIIGIICGLIFVQPDLSAAITIFLLGGLLFFLGGGDMKQIGTMLILAVIVILLVIKISSTGQSRMDHFLLGIKDLTKASDHVLYSFEAIIKGGWFGVGIGLASTKLVGLPFAPTDSIFAVIAEELGLVGAAVTSLLYGVLIWRGLRIANKAPDLLGSLLASGLTLWIGAEAAINMLVMVGLLPFAGNALPFISYGGSNLLSSFLAIGILMSVSRQVEPQSDSDEWRSLGASVDLRGRNRRRSLSRISRP
ncbi:MAG TPA: FtsW/RodA/SpoVE family cell cycle protein [Anaerolineales bacterium]|jgi:cell division protein FtsW